MERKEPLNLGLKLNDEEYRRIATAFIKGTALCPLSYDVSTIYIAKVFCDFFEKGISIRTLCVDDFPSSELDRLLLAKRQASTNKNPGTDESEKRLLAKHLQAAIEYSRDIISFVHMISEDPAGMRAVIEQIEEIKELLRKAGVFSRYREYCRKNGPTELSFVIKDHKAVDLERYLSDKPPEFSALIRKGFNFLY